MRRLCRTSAAASVASLSLLASTTAWAGGFEVGENGTRALGRGGAYVATVDEPSAIYFNPAALARLDGTRLTLNLNLVDYNLRFERDPFVFQEPASTEARGRRTIEFEPVEQQTKLFPAPMAFVSSRLGLQGWTLGFGAYGPSAMGLSRYPEMTRRSGVSSEDACGVYRPCLPPNQTITRDGGQGYMMTERSVLLVYPSLAVARLFERANLALGLTLQAAILKVDFTVGVDGSSFDVGDAEAESHEADDFFTPNTLDVLGVGATGIAGVHWTPTENLSFGASYRPQFKIRSTGDISIDFPPGLQSANPVLDDSSAELRIHFPDVVRAGAAYTARRDNGSELWDVEFNFVWENWSVTKYFDVRIAGDVSDDSGALSDRPVPQLLLGRYYDDAYSFRLGSDLSFLRDAETGVGPVFRVGASYETPSSPEEWTNVDFTPFARLGLTGGFSYHFSRVSLDLAYAAYLSPDRDVDNGQYDLIMPLWICEAPESTERYPAEACAQDLTPVHPVNNGHYETFTQTFSLGATYGW